MPKPDHGIKTKKHKPGFRGRVWIDGPEGTFIGYGRVVLLERIIEHGSITKAAKSMDMANRHAWDRLRSAHVALGQPLVVLARGRGAYLSEFGTRLVSLQSRARTETDSTLTRLAREVDRVIGTASTADYISSVPVMDKGRLSGIVLPEDPWSMPCKTNFFSYFLLVMSISDRAGLAEMSHKRNITVGKIEIYHG